LSFPAQAALKEADLSTIFDGLNVLGRVPWVINKKILEVGERCWNENIPLGDIPSRTDYNVPPMPTKPDAKMVALDKDSEAYKEARHEYGLYREEVLKHRRVHQKNMVSRTTMTLSHLRSLCMC
jgi:DNA-directed RNA polymerase